MFNFFNAKEQGNVMLVAKSGAGKSFFTNEIIRDVLSTSNQEGQCPLNRQKSSNDKVKPKGRLQG